MSGSDWGWKDPNPAREALTRAIDRAIAEGSPVYVEDPARLEILPEWSARVLEDSAKVLRELWTADDGRGDARDMAALLRSVVADLEQVAENLDPEG